LSFDRSGDKGDAGCGDNRPAVLDAGEGRIQSPRHGPENHYTDNANCQWRIEVPEGRVCSFQRNFVVKLFNRK